MKKRKARKALRKKFSSLAIKRRLQAKWAASAKRWQAYLRSKEQKDRNYGHRVADKAA